MCVSIRKWLYHSGLKKSVRLPVEVIGIGNIVAGGTGKTPCTIALARALSSSRRVGVVLRSYKAEQIDPSLVSKDDLAVRVGDEACLVKRHVPQAVVAVARKKVQAALLACSQGVQTLLVDDCLQHFKIHADRHIVLLDADNPFGYGYLLPRGMLREPLSSLRRASLIIINCRQALRDTSTIEEQVRKYSDAPIIKAVMKNDGLFDLYDEEVLLSAGEKVALFCGLAKPEQFVCSVKALGLQVVETAFLDDHRAFKGDAWLQFVQKAINKQARYIVCSEKDRVKITPSLKPELPIVWLRTRMEFESQIPGLMSGREM